MSTPINDLWQVIDNFEHLKLADMTPQRDLSDLDETYTDWYNDLMTAFRKVRNTMIPKEKCNAKE